MKKQFKIAFSMFAFALLTLVFAGVYAADKPTITITPAGGFFVGESQEFSITTNVPEEYEGIMVIGDGVISDESAIEKLEYFEVKDGNWYKLDSIYGGSTGFPLTNNATSKFRVTFKTAGEYTVTYGVKKVDGGDVLAENMLVIEVADKSARKVSTEAELRAALEDTSIKTINITKDMTIASKVNIVRDVTINGNSHKLTFTGIDNKVWGGHYVLQAYRCNVTLSDITLTGGNAGLLVNGAKVTIKGTLDVSGNGFGGIEVAKSGEFVPSLDLTNATVKNTTEAYKLPTIWEDPSLEDSVVTENEEQFFWVEEIEAANGNMQWQYYLEVGNAVDTPDNQLKEQIAAGEEEITIIVNNEDAVLSKDVLNTLKEGPEREIFVYLANKEYECGMIFNTKDITEDFTKDLDLNMNISNEQPFKSDILKDVKSDMLFIDLEYSGVLPKGTKIAMYADDFGYEDGDKFMIYYYNPTTDGMELISKEVVVDGDTLMFEIDHASTYVLSTKELPTKAAPAKPSNPNTSDMSIVIAVALGVVAVSGFVVVKKQKLFTK